MTLLTVSDLQVTFPHQTGELSAVRGVSFSLSAGERLGIVGESGAGKSVVASAILNLIPPPGKITNGSAMFEGANLFNLSPTNIRNVRGRRIAMIFQDPTTTLNPTLTIGQQLIECLIAHNIASGDAAWKMAITRLREVSIPSPESRMNAYPHELSGGMRQRVIIAAALITEPALIIADEPTTALDVTIQADIMALLAQLCQQRQMALILITHDLSLVSQMTDNLLVMYAGLVIERGSTARIVSRPNHPYSQGLLASLTKRRAGGRFYQIPGSMPPLTALPTGCAFHPRCAHVRDICHKQLPPLSVTNIKTNDSAVACHFAKEIAANV